MPSADPWRFADRFDLQMLVQSARSVARGTVARLVAAASATPTSGPRPKQKCLKPSIERSDRCFMEPEEGGLSPAQKTGLILSRFELAG